MSTFVCFNIYFLFLLSQSCHPVCSLLKVCGYDKGPGRKFLTGHYWDQIEKATVIPFYNILFSVFLSPLEMIIYINSRLLKAIDVYVTCVPSWSIYALYNDKIVPLRNCDNRIYMHLMLKKTRWQVLSNQ